MSTENDFNEASTVWSGTSPPKVLTPHFLQSQAVVCRAWKLLSQLKSENEAFTIFYHLKNTYCESSRFQMLYHTCSSLIEKAQNFVFVHSFPHTLEVTDCQKLRLIEKQQWFLSVIHSMEAAYSTQHDLCSVPSLREQTYATTNGKHTPVPSLLEGKGLGNAEKPAGNFQGQELLEAAPLFAQMVKNRREIIANHYGRKWELQISSLQKSFEKTNA